MPVATIPPPVVMEVLYSTLKRRSGNLNSAFQFASLAQDLYELYPAIKNTLEEFRNLKENWDGYGAVAIEGETIQNVYTFLHGAFPFILSKLKEDEIEPTPLGTIILGWANKSGMKISVEIGSSAYNYFIRRPEATIYSSPEIKISSILPEDLSTAFLLIGYDA